MRALFEQAHRDHGAIGIFSLGRDGEIRDAFDAREKPHVYLRAGMLAVVSRSALRAGLAVACCELLSCVNALGQLVVIRALADVTVAITGPPSGAALVLVVEALRRHGAREIFVDGALDRIAPFAMIDPAFVVVSGMAAFSDVGRVGEYLKLFAERLSLAAVPDETTAYELRGVVDAERISEVLAQQTLRDVVIDDPLRMTHDAFVVARRRCRIWSRKRYTVIACATQCIRAVAFVRSASTYRSGCAGNTTNDG